MVCCAACSAGDCRDLKTGYLWGAPRRLQQYAEVIGADAGVRDRPGAEACCTIPISSRGGLKAPQATLFASLAGGMFG